ncbi:hypothetical protein T05_5394, partial [Trichinella murrelli]
LRNSFRCGKCRSIHCVKFRRTGEIQAKNWHYNTRRTVPFKFIKCTGYITRDRRFAKVLFFLCSLNLLGCFCRFALSTFSLLTYESVGGSVRPRCSGSKACQASLTGAGREWTVGLGSSWPTEYGQSRKRSTFYTCFLNVVNPPRSSNVLFNFPTAS